MIERRQGFRSRVIYGGVIAFNGRASTIDCVVRNFSNLGARIELQHGAVLPEEFDLTIARKSRAFLARIVWRDAGNAGLAFRDPAEAGAPVQLDWARRLRDGERTKRRLQNRVDQLRSER